MDREPSGKISRINRCVYPASAVLLLASACFIYAAFLRTSPLPEGLIEANGRIEGDHVTVSSKFSGRIEKLLVREGDLVRSQQGVVLLDDTQTRTKVDQAREARFALEEQVRASKMALEVLRKEVPLAIESAGAASAQAAAVSSKAGAVEQQAGRDARRMERLLLQGAVSRRTAEQSDLAFKEARAQSSESRSALKRARKQLAQALLGMDRIRVREGELRSLGARLKQAEAGLAEARSVLSDFLIRAPSDGVVLTRIANLGEMASPGAVLMDLVDLDHLHLKVYIPEDLVGKVRVGLPARIYADSFPNRPVPATVSMISSQAEFTPKEVQTQDERTRLVYGVKLSLDKNPDRFMTPGMPCDAVIRWKENVRWEAPRW